MAVARGNASSSPGRRIPLLFGGAGGTGAPLICLRRGPTGREGRGDAASDPVAAGFARPVKSGSDGQIRDKITKPRTAMCVVPVGRRTRRPETVPRTDVSTAAGSRRCCHLQIA